jgi:hypothetical protein
LTKGLSDADLLLLKGLAGHGPIPIDPFALSRLMTLGLVGVDGRTRKLFVTRTGTAWIKRIAS